MTGNGQSAHDRPGVRGRAAFASSAAARFRALDFVRCPDCRMDPLTGRGPRACRQPRCPYLPRELDPCCPDCGFNVATGAGRPSCGGPGLCAFNEREGARRLALLRAWWARQDVG